MRARRQEAVEHTKWSGHQVLPRADTNGPLICLLQSAQIGILAVLDGFITPRPLLGADRWPLEGEPLAGMPPMSGSCVGFGIPLDIPGANETAGSFFGICVLTSTPEAGIPPKAVGAFGTAGAGL